MKLMIQKIGLVVLILVGGIGVFWWKLHSTHIDMSREHAIYFCPMHPSVTSDKPGQCPICHMDLQKREEKKQSKKEAEPQTSESHGRATFELSPERQQLIGVTTAPVQKHVLTYEVRASGKVAFDPELYSTIEEYLQALKSEKIMAKSSFKDLQTQGRELVDSAYTKLKLMGLSPDQIQKLAQGGKSPKNLLLPEKSVWIYAEVFEYEISGLKYGQKIDVIVPSIPGKVFYGTVSSISPILNAPTRTFRVRAEVPDPNKELRPDTFVNVKITVDLGEKLVVPLDAVLHSGDSHVVFIVQGEGKFEPKQVTLGTRTKEYYEVISGVTEGEIVVTAANFLIDSESRLRGVLEKMKPGEMSHEHH